MENNKEKLVCELADLYRLRKTVQLHKDSEHPELKLMVKNFYSELKPTRIKVLEQHLSLSIED